MVIDGPSSSASGPAELIEWFVSAYSAGLKLNNERSFRLGCGSGEKYPSRRIPDTCSDCHNSETGLAVSQRIAGGEPVYPA